MSDETLIRDNYHLSEPTNGVGGAKTGDDAMHSGMQPFACLVQSIARKDSILRSRVTS
jgi:hypothetical protein